MNKILVRDTIRFAYGFAFGQIGTIIGLVWLPMLLVGVLQFLPYAIGTASTQQEAYPGAAGAVALLNLVFSMAGIILYAVNCVSVTRQALGLREGPASIHFALGRPEWRMFGAIVLCGLVLVTVLGLYLLALSLSAGFAKGGMAVLLGPVVALFGIAGACGFIYVVVRLVFLLAPVVVAEEKIDLGRSWTLTAGNFWRILAVGLAVTIPLLVVQGIALAAIVGPELFAPLPGNAASLYTALEVRFQLFDRHVPSLIGLALILTPFSLGLNLGAEAAAYRALVPARRNSSAS